ncbi:FtsX-like permease family protein [Natronoglomus mannanivorans]|uniref:ABC transporter permease n=1 Tax=Natronoglomus mannanivorans TaxID=2979990 RepID=A0AAP3E407_9EURY|nr:ABC transporter permease [Halobacteria archaeon AArc-xg1-1]
MSLRTLLARWYGVAAVGMRRTLARTTHTARQRVRFSVLGVAVAITLLLVVTGIGMGLTGGTTVQDDGIDYWIVPESGGSSSPLVSTDAPQFGSVHETAETIRATEGVDSVSPVLSQVLRVSSAESTEYVLVVGIVNDGGVDQISGVNVTGLSHHDPYYNDGEWTGEVALSRSAGATLDATEGDQLTIGGNTSFAVTSVDGDTSSAVGDVPTAVVQLSELQTLTGATAHDSADQFVVGTNDPAVRADLEDVYPSSTVNSRSEMTASQTMDSDLSVALALTAFVVAISIGTLFVVTTMGLELVADRTQLATMSAIGLSGRTQLGIIAVQILATTAIGGIVGAIGGLAGIRLTNELAMRTLTSEPIAFSHPIFGLYGVVVAVLIGICSLPVLLLVTRRVTGGVPQ